MYRSTVVLTEIFSSFLPLSDFVFFYRLWEDVTGVHTLQEPQSFNLFEIKLNFIPPRQKVIDWSSKFEISTIQGNIGELRIKWQEQ